MGQAFAGKMCKIALDLAFYFLLGGKVTRSTQQSKKNIRWKIQNMKKAYFASLPDDFVISSVVKFSAVVG